MTAVYTLHEAKLISASSAPLFGGTLEQVLANWEDTGEGVGLDAPVYSCSLPFSDSMMVEITPARAP